MAPGPALYDEDRDQDDGTVGRPRPITSRMIALGAFPAGHHGSWRHLFRPILERIERLRRSVDDPSRPPATVPLLVDIRAESCTPGWTIATPTGDTLLDFRRSGSGRTLRLQAPVGTAWLVSVPSIGRAQGTGDPARTFGPFRSDVPGLISGTVSGDVFLWGAETGSVSWRPASAEEAAGVVAGHGPLSRSSRPWRFVRDRALVDVGRLPLR